MLKTNNFLTTDNEIVNLIKKAVTSSFSPDMTATSILIITRMGIEPNFYGMPLN